MRVVAGTARGRRLVAPGRARHPPDERPGARVHLQRAAQPRRRSRAPPSLDLFAGSGALGIEALSRGRRATARSSSRRAPPSPPSAANLDDGGRGRPGHASRPARPRPTWPPGPGRSTSRCATRPTPSPAGPASWRARAARPASWCASRTAPVDLPRGLGCRQDQALWRYRGDIRPAGRGTRNVSGLSKVLYPGSFDPLHNGHLEIIEIASRLFGDVIVVAMVNRTKEGFFPLDERVAMIEESVAHLDNVRVATSEGLVVDAADALRRRFRGEGPPDAGRLRSGDADGPHEQDGERHGDRVHPERHAPSGSSRPATSARSPPRAATCRTSCRRQWPGP